VRHAATELEHPWCEEMTHRMQWPCSLRQWLGAAPRWPAHRPASLYPASAHALLAPGAPVTLPRPAAALRRYWPAGASTPAHTEQVRWWPAGASPPMPSKNARSNTHSNPIFTQIHSPPRLQLVTTIPQPHQRCIKSAHEHCPRVHRHPGRRHRLNTANRITTPIRPATGDDVPGDIAQPPPGHTGPIAPTHQQQGWKKDDREEFVPITATPSSHTAINCSKLVEDMNADAFRVIEFIDEELEYVGVDIILFSEPTVQADAVGNDLASLAGSLRDPVANKLYHIKLGQGEGQIAVKHDGTGSLFRRAIGRRRLHTAAG